MICDFLWSYGEFIQVEDYSIVNGTVSYLTNSQLWGYHLTIKFEKKHVPQVYSYMTHFGI
jgi:hypothetical protein